MIMTLFVGLILVSLHKVLEMEIALSQTDIKGITKKQYAHSVGTDINYTYQSRCQQPVTLVLRNRLSIFLRL